MFSNGEPRSSQRRNWFKRGLRLIVLTVLSFAGPGAVLAAILGDDIAFTHGPDTLPEVTRTHASFSEAAEEANESRIFTGAHFHSSCNDGQKAAPGNFTITNPARVNRDKNHNLFDADGNAESVSSAPPCSSPVTVNPPTLPNGTKGVDYSITLKASGGYQMNGARKGSTHKPGRFIGAP